MTRNDYSDIPARGGRRGGHHGPPLWAASMTAGDERRGRGRSPSKGKGRPRGRGRGFPGPSGSFFGRGPRANRGDVRAAILALLDEEPMHGYQIIRELGERSGGVWTPSPGSVYPTLQLLEEEGLVQGEDREGKKTFTLTDTGRAAHAARPAGPAPWQEVGEDVDNALVELRDVVGQVAAAVRQIAHSGTPAQVAAAKALLTDAKRSLYRILADDPGDAPE